MQGFFEPMNWTAASDETETFWHLGFSPWLPDPVVDNFT
jgi:hypothetical protein